MLDGDDLAFLVDGDTIKDIDMYVDLEQDSSMKVLVSAAPASANADALMDPITGDDDERKEGSTSIIEECD